MFARMSQFYKMKPGRLGAEVFGIDLAKSQPQEVIDKIKADVTEHRQVFAVENQS